MTTEDSRTVQAGIVGLGMAGAMIVRSLGRLPGLKLAAAADLRENALGAFREQYGGRIHTSIERLCDDPDVEAVWVATPTPLHCRHVVALCNAGKHVIVEKPMAVNLEECQEMIEAAERNHVVLIAGGSRSFEPAFVAMREVVTSGRIGGLRALSSLAFTGWMTRAREPHEIDVDNGGGAIYNQAAHPIDVLRLLGGGMVRSVRGSAVDTGLPGRPCPGYFSAFLEFEDGTPASFVYDGYGYIGSWELVPWGETPGRQRAQDGSNAYRRALRTGTADEYEARELLRYGGRRDEVGTGGGFGGDGGWTPQDAGLVIAVCERGEVRQSREGLYVYEDDGRHDEPLRPGTDMRGNELAELRDAIAGRRQPLHSGAWGMATLEVLLAIIESAATHRELELRHQVPVRG